MFFPRSQAGSECQAEQDLSQSIHTGYYLLSNSAVSKNTQPLLNLGIRGQPTGTHLTAKMSLLYKTLQENVSCKARVSRHQYLGKAQPQSLVGCSGGHLLTDVVSHPGRSGPGGYTGEKQKPCVQTAEEWFEWDSPGPSNSERKPLEPRMAELRWEEFFNTQSWIKPSFLPLVHKAF